MQSGVTVAASNKKKRQEALRDYLSNRGLVEHVIDIAEKLADLDNDIPPEKVTRMKHAADINLKLVNKYLPDLKSTELTADVDEAGKVTGIQISFVDADKHTATEET